MDDWATLRADLAVLLAQDPSPLRSWPSLEYQPSTPWRIWLKPWAQDVAADLVRRFGADVAVQLGVFSYPDRHGSWPLPDVAALPRVDPAELTVALAGPATVHSGHEGRVPFRIGNRTAAEVRIVTGWALQADVVDPRTGVVVGGYAGVNDAVRDEIVVHSGQTTVVHLLVGTDSFDPALGYAVPPGEWGLEVSLDLYEGPTLRTPTLPLTILATA